MASVKAARELESIVKFWDLEPGNSLLSGREENEAYLTSLPGKVYIIFFTNGGEAGLDLSSIPYGFSLKWMDVRKGEWASKSRIKGGKIVSLKAPGAMEWIAVLEKR